MTYSRREGPWEVHCSAAIAKAFRTAQSKAEQLGIGAEALSAIKTIRKRLTFDPQEFGEPLYRLPALQMDLRHAIVLPLAVDYGVCEDRLVVFVRGAKLLAKPDA
jgi:hypothetical protein